MEAVAGMEKGIKVNLSLFCLLWDPQRSEFCGVNSS